MSLMFPSTLALVTGVEDHPDGGVKVYVGARWKNRYVVIDDPADAEKMRAEWARSYCGHLFIPTPSADALFVDAGARAGDQT